MLHDDVKMFAGAAAIILSGREDVELNFVYEDKQNATDFPPGRRAYCEKSSEGKPAIYIADYESTPWNAEQFIRTIAHESAHVRMHWDFLVGGIPIDDLNHIREREASNFASKWTTYALGYGDTYFPEYAASYKAECPLTVKQLRPLYVIADLINNDLIQF